MGDTWIDATGRSNGIVERREERLRPGRRLIASSKHDFLRTEKIDQSEIGPGKMEAHSYCG